MLWRILCGIAVIIWLIGCRMLGNRDEQVQDKGVKVVGSLWMVGWIVAGVFAIFYKYPPWCSILFFGLGLAPFSLLLWLAMNE